MVILSTPKLLQKADRATENGISIADPVNNPNAIPATINISFLLISSIPLKSFWTGTIYGTWFQQLLCYSTAPMIKTLCPFSTLNQQLTNLYQTQLRCSLHCEQWKVKGRDWVSAFHFFKEITYQTDDWPKQLLRWKSWVMSGSPAERLEFRRLWWIVIEINGCCLFQSFDVFCCFVGLRKTCCFSLFCSISLVTLSEK